MTIVDIQESLKKYKDELHSLITKSNDIFEKQLSYISSGSLALSFILVEKVIVDISGSHCKFLLVLGWVSLASSLLVNLLSHKVAARYHGETLLEIDNTLKLKEGDDYTSECYDTSRANGRRSRIGKYNSWSIWLLFGGLISIVLYSTINIFSSSHAVDFKNEKQIIINNYNSDIMSNQDQIPNQGQQSEILKKGLEGSPTPQVSKPESGQRGLEGSPLPQIPTIKKD